jgi:hypothetical protein
VHPRVCPLCGARDEHLGRDFEHVSMQIAASGTTVFLRCRRCQRVFAWPYGQRPAQDNGKHPDPQKRKTT